MLNGAGVETGLDVAGLVEASQWLAGVMSKPLPGMVARAPAFPPVEA
jgi:hydroxymethylglutaryl-CoA lyase